MAKTKTNNKGIEVTLNPKGSLQSISIEKLKLDKKVLKQIGKLRSFRLPDLDSSTNP